MGKAETHPDMEMWNKIAGYRVGGKLLCVECYLKQDTQYTGYVTFFDLKGSWGIETHTCGVCGKDLELGEP
jgi:hypothetical protein